MTLDQKRKKIIDYILKQSGNTLYEEIQFLVENTVINDDDVIICYDYVFRDENDKIVFEED